MAILTASSAASSKQQILEQYLNVVYLGSSAYGV
ncbi:MAG TPA: hypothetical protein DCR20_05865, partial [Planctomycetaceae bacterium]|nr:hypothetical protein [Planctomycetaceae bacterium]